MNLFRWAIFEQLLGEYQKAPDVTRERLYIDAIQSVMTKSSTVMVDVEGGNNIMYLPLDRMMGGSKQAQLPEVDGSEVARRITDEVMDRLRRQSATNFRRGESR